MNKIFCNYLIKEEEVDKRKINLTSSLCNEAVLGRG
jgi:hypothetical protein